MSLNINQNEPTKSVLHSKVFDIPPHHDLVCFALTYTRQYQYYGPQTWTNPIIFDLDQNKAIHLKPKILSSFRLQHTAEYTLILTYHTICYNQGLLMYLLSLEFKACFDHSLCKILKKQCVIVRVVASLTVPGGQVLHDPQFFLKFQLIFPIFPQIFLIF